MKKRTRQEAAVQPLRSESLSLQIAANCFLGASGHVAEQQDDANDLQREGGSEPHISRRLDRTTVNNEQRGERSRK